MALDQVFQYSIMTSETIILLTLQYLLFMEMYKICLNYQLLYDCVVHILHQRGLCI